jgi:hypothetical protein
MEVAEEARVEAECAGDPTAKWGFHRPPPGAPFAVAFAGAHSSLYRLPRGMNQAHHIRLHYSTGPDRYHDNF